MMTEPLLSSLCRICNTNPPKYRCPRCSSQTCSLACSKKHKLWSECNGVRDPTIYKPRHELATPAGIDHDYNFISAIERGMERTDRAIVDEKGLVQRNELWGDRGNIRRNTRQRGGGDSALTKALERSAVMVDRAPMGMKRNKDNNTSWSKSQRCINWQVEWVGNDGCHTLGKVLESHPIGDAYANLLEEHRRANMTEAEKKQDKKRKADEIRTLQKNRAAKKIKIDHANILFLQKAIFQNPQSSSWDLEAATEGACTAPEIEADTMTVSSSPGNSFESPLGLYFYLLRPYTPSSRPRVLIPLDPSRPLSTLMQGHVVLEFPTIYVLPFRPTSLPEDFMLEDQYLRKGRPQVSRDRQAVIDEDMEDGEVV